ncbi:MAG: FG-GAP repeat domain-containing protein [Planctomycetaceae bacterium]
MKAFLGFAITLAIAVTLLLPYTFEPVPALKLHTKDGDVLLTAYGEEKLEGEIQTFCTQCHGFPDPALYPAYHWPSEIDRAYNFHEQSGDPDILEPDSQLVLAWFKKNATRTVEITKGEGPKDKTVFGSPTKSPKLKSRAGTSSFAVRHGEDTTILSTDMLNGKITSFQLGSSDYEVLYRGTNPSRIRPCDLSDQFEEEYLVSELGTPGVTDELCGKVVWLRRTGSTEEFEAVTICDQVGRVSDAKAADFDGDGDADVLIAEFGWNKTGSVILLEQDEGKFNRSEIDGRHGLVEIGIADFNNDGMLDFAGIFGQEFETVEIFYNQGSLNFEPTQLFQAETPSFGICSLNLVDADNDGDLDIQFTSGDMYDGYHFQDTHGLYLLTNNDGQFESQMISEQPAVLSSTAGDVDGDGDIDFIGGTFIPQQSSYALTSAYPAIVLHEQTSPGVWEQRVLKSGDCCHAALKLHDMDKDGDLDLVVGTLHDVRGKPEPGIAIWENHSSK